MDLQLKGKTALITGGSEGIGKGIAMNLAREGVDVAICARRKGPLEATAQEIRDATGVKVVALTADLTKDAEAKAFILEGAKALGRVDIMVNNAGSSPGGSPGSTAPRISASSPSTPARCAPSAGQAWSTPWRAT